MVITNPGNPATITTVEGPSTAEDDFCFQCRKQCLRKMIFVVITQVMTGKIKYTNPNVIYVMNSCTKPVLTRFHKLIQTTGNNIRLTMDHCVYIFICNNNNKNSINTKFRRKGENMVIMKKHSGNIVNMMASANGAFLR